MNNALRTVPQFCERNEAFTHGSVRWIIFRSGDDSDPTYSKFRPAIHRIGRKILIDEPKFLAIAKGRKPSIAEVSA
jgi:hypothetical protein